MWYLISKKDTEKIQQALQAAIDLVDDRCGSTGCLCDLRGYLCSQYFSDGLHTLETGLHEMNDTPPDSAT